MSVSAAPDRAFGDAVASQSSRKSAQAASINGTGPARTNSRLVGNRLARWQCHRPDIAPSTPASV